MDITEYAKTANDDWLKAEDLKGQSVVLDIKSIEVVTFGSEDPNEHKLGLKFEGRDKGIVSNKSNSKRLAKAFGAESDNWIGKKITARDNETNLGLGFRLDPYIAEDELNDDIPF